MIPRAETLGAEVEVFPDFGRQPDPLACEGCGREHPWVWYQPRALIEGKPVAPRWAAPSISPCRLCATIDEVSERRDLTARLRRAGIPERAIGYRLDRVIAQKADEPLELFRARCRARPGMLGVSVTTASVLMQLSAYRPPGWVVIHGPPGTGKTTLIGALATKLLTLPPERWEGSRPSEPCRPGARTLRRKRTTPIRYFDVGDLVDREIVRMRGLDNAPTVDAAKSPGILVLDDLGAREVGAVEQKLIQRIVMFRHRYNRPTILVSNLEADQLLGPRSVYGPAVASRLSEALELEVRGDDWRSAW